MVCVYCWLGSELCSDCGHDVQEGSASWWLACSRARSFQRGWCRLKSPRKTKAASGLKSMGFRSTTSAMAGMVVNVVGGLYMLTKVRGCTESGNWKEIRVISWDGEGVMNRTWRECGC